MTIQEAIIKHQESNVHIFTEWGVYISDGWGLKFDKKEYNKHFGYGCYLPDEEEWLLENSSLVRIEKIESRDENEYKAL